MFLRKRNLSIAAVLLSAVGLGAVACNILNPVVCTLEYRYGIYGTIVDNNGDAIPGLTITISSQNYSEQAVIFDETQYVGAGEREGTYSISAAATGYQSRTITGVIVTGDECHVTPVKQDIVLTKN
ncbi:MAG TPA: carboxypeptidase-like regulatory domain-containing protein [Phycisphaerae bacterium]|nr:carboxypeptidase-like regulatory domain-containing protein [Phycisphaerae bacterium]HRW55619.1 carboxypeptidase-like regulatory domain-containing protein [Phycisphaerae bacterium]